MRKKTSLIIFALVFVFGIAHVFAGEQDFMITSPAGWNQKKDSSAPAHYMMGTGSFIVTIDKMPPNAAKPDTYITFVKEQLGKAFKKITFEPVVSGKRDGLDTRELVYKAEVSGMTLKYDVLYIFNKGKAYTLTGSNMEDSYNVAFALDIKSFFESFKIK